MDRETPVDHAVDEAASAVWDQVLRDGHGSLVRARRVFRYLPSSPQVQALQQPVRRHGRPRAPRRGLQAVAQEPEPLHALLRLVAGRRRRGGHRRAVRRHPRLHGAGRADRGDRLRGPAQPLLRHGDADAAAARRGDRQADRRRGDGVLRPRHHGRGLSPPSGGGGHRSAAGGRLRHRFRALDRTRRRRQRRRRLRGERGLGRGRLHGARGSRQRRRAHAAERRRRRAARRRRGTTTASQPGHPAGRWRCAAASSRSTRSSSAPEIRRGSRRAGPGSHHR